MLSPPRFHKTKESGREKPVAPPHTPGMGEGSWAVSPATQGIHDPTAERPVLSKSPFVVES